VVEGGKQFGLALEAGKPIGIERKGCGKAAF
jgi:hypothetical protein